MSLSRLLLSFIGGAAGPETGAGGLPAGGGVLPPTGRGGVAWSGMGPSDPCSPLLCTCCVSFRLFSFPLSRLVALPPPPFTDVGFDPFGFTNYIDLKFLREAEIKHCRITMLAVLGLFVQEFYTLPFYAGGPALAEPAHNYFVAQGAMKQLLLWTSGLEVIVGVPALQQMMQGSGRRYVFFHSTCLPAPPPSTSVQPCVRCRRGDVALAAEERLYLTGVSFCWLVVVCWHFSLVPVRCAPFPLFLIGPLPLVAGAAPGSLGLTP